MKIQIQSEQMTCVDLEKLLGLPVKQIAASPEGVEIDIEAEEVTTEQQALLMDIYGAGVEVALERKKEREANHIVGRIATRELVKSGDLSAEDIQKIAPLYPDWQVGIEYKVDDIVNFMGVLYKVIQAHTSQSDWTPDKTASLFVSTLPAGEIGEWKQPTGAHDAYNTGDLVWYGSPDNVYKSLIDGNVWSPSGYPQGWELQS